MKKIQYVFAGLIAAVAVGTLPLFANTTVVAPHPGTVVVREIPVLVDQAASVEREFEGRIAGVDYTKNRILVHDSEGHDRSIQLPLGLAPHFKVNSVVRIRLMPASQEAEMIWILR